MGFNVIIDTREQNPWSLSSASINSTISKKLNTGDYSIEGYEDVLCIERKKTVAEIAANMSEQRFVNELERMKDFKYKFLILEFSMSKILEFPAGSSIPQKKWESIKVRGPFILMRLSHIQVNYGIHVVFAGNTANAEYVAVNIMKRVSGL